MEEHAKAAYRVGSQNIFSKLMNEKLIFNNKMLIYECNHLKDNSNNYLSLLT